MNVDAVAPIRAPNMDTLTMILHEWNNTNEATQDFVLQVVASHLEEHLLLWLLQSHVDDAMADVQDLLIVCSTSIANRVESLEVLMDTLLTVAIVRAAAFDRNGRNRSRQLGVIRDMIESGILKTSQSQCVVRTLDTNDHDVELWTQFIGLSNTFDTRLFTSPSGRAFLEVAAPIVSLQQSDLEEARGKKNGEWVSVEEKEDQTRTANALWDLAKQLVMVTQMKTDKMDAQQSSQCPDRSTTLCLSIVEIMTEMETYLKAKGTLGLCCSNVSCAHILGDDDTELSAIEMLSRLCISRDEKAFISSDILEKAFNELSAIEHINVISIQASFLLGLQMRLQICFVDYCDSVVKDEFEKNIRRVFNCLTNNAQDMKDVVSLVILSAFCPGQVIRQCILGARADTLHHHFYLEVFHTSPLLMDWTQSAEHESTTFLECELQQTVLDVSSNQNNFDRESQNVMSFLLSIVGIRMSSSLKRKTPVMTINKLLDRVIHPVCFSVDVSIEPHRNLYTLIQQLFQHFVAANACLDLDYIILERSFNLILKALCSFNGCKLRSGVLIRETLLLLLTNIIELMPRHASVVIMEQPETPLHPLLWTLLNVFDSSLVSDQRCKGSEDVASVDAFMQGKSIGASQSVLTLPAVMSAIQVLLWELLWDTTLPAKAKVKSSQAQRWSLVDGIAQYEFLMSDSATETTSGAFLIQCAITEMMLECGGVLFQALLGRVIPYLLEYEPKTSSGDKLGMPKWAADKLSKQLDFELQIPCDLVSTHLIMRYVASCWGLSSATSVPLITQDNVLLLESLSHVLVAYEPAITSSRGSLSGTLFCIQWLCFLASTACEMQFYKMLRWPTVRTQFELLLLRSLHQVEQLKEISTSEAQFSQHFVAVWLAYLPPGQFVQIFGFVASRTRT